MPKKRKNVLFMGRYKSGFLDNVKYLYLYLQENGYDKDYNLYFMGHRDNVVDQLQEMGFKAINFSIYKSILANTSGWVNYYR